MLNQNPPQSDFRERGPIIYPAVGDELGWKRVRGFRVPFSPALGVGSSFTEMITARIRKEKPCNIVVVGEPGASKTYSSLSIARYLQPKHFAVKNIVMAYQEFMENMINLRQGRIIVYDEMEYDAGHRDWGKPQNKALVSTMRSGRFKVHPIIMPVINKRLLDKVIRENLVQFMVWVTERGEASTYRVNPSQFTDETRYEFINDLRIEMLDSDKCQRRWCMTCPDFKTCTLLRGEYERKRGAIQDARYKEDLERAKAESQPTDPKALFKAHLIEVSEHRERYTVVQKMAKGNEKISFSVELIELGVGCGPSEAQKIRRLVATLGRDHIRQVLKGEQPNTENS